MESVWGEAPTALLDATQLFGVFDDCSLPDPTFEMQPWWIMNPAARNYYVAYKGRARSEGAIPNIILLDGRPIFLPLADAIEHSAGPAPYTHTINGTIKLPSFRVVATNYSDDDTAATELVRWFVGGKVNRATYQCDEGGLLTMSLDDISFKMPHFKDENDTNIQGWYNEHAVSQTFDYTCTEPYYFSEGCIKMKLPLLGMDEIIIPSVRSFRLDVNNNLDPKYYIATNAEKVPYEIIEGRREFRLALQVDLVDQTSVYGESVFTKDTPFLELLNQGMDGTVFKGAAVEITFTKSTNDYIKFTTPASYDPDCGPENQGALLVRGPTNIVTESVISVPMEMICRDLKVEIGDSLAGAVYPV